MKLLLFSLSLLAPMTCSAASVQCPVKETVAYSRQTTSGIPGPRAMAGVPDRSGKPIRVSYFVYVVLQKGAVPSPTSGVWLDGKYYAAALRRVDSPVEVEHDAAVPTGQKDTLVGKTSDDVYRIELGEEKPWKPRDEAEGRLAQTHPAVVFLRVGQAACPCPVKEIKELPPAPGM